jgi:hypothetical protein
MKRLWSGGRDAEGIATSEMERQLSDAARDEKWVPSTFNHCRSLLMLATGKQDAQGK